jgi:hypothetical protein
MPRKSFAQKTAELAKKQPEHLDIMDKFRAHYFGGYQLSVMERKSLDQIRSIWAIYCENTSRLQTIAIFKKKTKLGDAQCYKILKDSMKLFGDVNKVDRDAERLASSEFYMSMAKLAIAQGDYKTAMECREKVDKLHALFDPDEIKIPMEKLMPTVNFVFVSDPEALKAQQTGETENIDHELVDGED